MRTREREKRRESKSRWLAGDGVVKDEGAGVALSGSGVLRPGAGAQPAAAAGASQEEENEALLKFSKKKVSAHATTN